MHSCHFTKQNTKHFFHNFYYNFPITVIAQQQYSDNVQQQQQKGEAHKICTKCFISSSTFSTSCMKHDDRVWLVSAVCGIKANQTYVSHFTMPGKPSPENKLTGENFTCKTFHTSLVLQWVLLMYNCREHTFILYVHVVRISMRQVRL